MLYQYHHKFEQPMRITHHMHPLSYRQIHTTASYYKFSFFPSSVVTWNNLPAITVMQPELKGFKQSLLTPSASWILSEMFSFNALHLMINTIVLYPNSLLYFWSFFQYFLTLHQFIIFEDTSHQYFFKIYQSEFIFTSLVSNMRGFFFKLLFAKIYDHEKLTRWHTLSFPFLYARKNFGHILYPLASVCPSICPSVC